MKHIFTLCIALFFMAGTQNTQAQTKEETIQWLNDYGKEIILSSDDEIGNHYKYFFEGFDGEFLTFICVYNGKGGNWIAKYTHKILPQDILYQDFLKFDDNNFGESEDNQKITKLKAKPATIFYIGIGNNLTFLNGTKVEENKKSEINFTFKKEESKDALRLFKAIIHLSKLSGASELPKVTEKTF